MRTVFLWIYVFLMAANAGLVYVDATIGTPITTPFDHCQIGGVATTQYSDEATCTANGGTWGNTLATVTNPTTVDPNNQVAGNSVVEDLQGDLTDAGSPWDAFLNAAANLANVGTTAIQFITGAFVWEAIAMFGLPALFVQGMQGIIGFFLVITIVSFVRPID